MHEKNLEIMTFLSSYDEAFCFWSHAVEKIGKEYKNIPKVSSEKSCLMGHPTTGFGFPPTYGQNLSLTYPPQYTSPLYKVGTGPYS